MILALILAYTETFLGPNSSQVVLQPGKYTFTCFGAQGGGGTNAVQAKYSVGGNGAKTSGTLNVKGNRTFYFTAGGKGESATKQKPNCTDGGFNGGGIGYKANDSFEGGGGGGASDIRIDMNDTSHRIMVAAGGSGGSGQANGVPGGNITGMSFISGSYKSSTKTTQTEGNETGKGDDGKENNHKGASGGGGGYRGGTVGKSSPILTYVSDSGSSYISGHENCTDFSLLDEFIVFEDAVMEVGGNIEKQDGYIVVNQVFSCPENCYSCTTSDACDECDAPYVKDKEGNCIPKTSGPSLNFSSSSLFSNSDSFSFSEKFTNSESFTQSQPMSNSISFSSSSSFSKSEEFLSSEAFSSSYSFTKTNYYTTSESFTNSGQFSNSNSFSNSIFFTKSGLFSDSNDFSISKLFTKSGFFSETNEFSNSKQFTESVKFSNSQYFSYSESFSESMEFSMSQTNLPKESSQDQGDLESSSTENDKEESSSSENDTEESSSTEDIGPIESSNNDNDTTYVEDSSSNSVEPEISNSQSEVGSKSNTLSIILIIISSIIAICIIIAIVILCKRRKPKEADTISDINEFQTQTQQLGETSFTDTSIEDQDAALTELNDPFATHLEEVLA